MVSNPPSIEDSLPLGEDKKNVRSLNSAFASSPFASSSCNRTPAWLLIYRRAGVVEWQTRRTQNPVGATLCGFKSHLRHQSFQ